MIANHTCREGQSCTCSIQALEPDERCPLHGYPWPPRCEHCGRFMKHPDRAAVLDALTAQAQALRMGYEDDGGN